MRALTITNRGASTAWVTDLRITPAATTPVFGLDEPELPVIEPRAAASLQVSYLPASGSGDVALLEAQIAGNGFSLVRIEEFLPAELDDVARTVLAGEAIEGWRADALRGLQVDFAACGLT